MNSIKVNTKASIKVSIIVSIIVSIRVSTASAQSHHITHIRIPKRKEENSSITLSTTA